MSNETTIVLETERMVLRRFVEEDAPLLLELDSDPEVVRFVDVGLSPDLDKIRNELIPYLLNYYERNVGFGVWAAIEKASGDFLGWFLFRPSARDASAIELGYRLRRAAWGRGLATEGSRALVEMGFKELGVEQVVAMAMARNVASRRVMEKVGLRYVGDFEESRLVGDDKTAVLYRIESEEYKRLHDVG